MRTRNIVSVMLSLLILVVSATNLCMANDEEETRATQIVETCLGAIEVAQNKFHNAAQKAQADHETLMAKLRSKFTATIVAAKEEAIKELVAIINTRSEDADPRGMAATWREIGKIDLGHLQSTKMLTNKATRVLRTAKLLGADQGAVAAIVGEYIAARDLQERQCAETVNRSESQRDEGLKAAREAAIRNLVAIATAKAKSRDVEGALQAWRAVRKVNPDHVQANRVLKAAEKTGRVKKPNQLLGDMKNVVAKHGRANFMSLQAFLDSLPPAYFADGITGLQQQSMTAKHTGKSIYIDGAVLSVSEYGKTEIQLAIIAEVVLPNQRKKKLQVGTAFPMAMREKLMGLKIGTHIQMKGVMRGISFLNCSPYMRLKDPSLTRVGPAKK